MVRIISNSPVASLSICAARAGDALNGTGTILMTDKPAAAIPYVYASKGIP